MTWPLWTSAEPGARMAAADFRGANTPHRLPINGSPRRWRFAPSRDTAGRCDPAADSSPLASGLGSDNLFSKVAPSRVRSPRFFPPQPSRSSPRSPAACRGMGEVISNILPVQFTELGSPSPRSGLIRLGLIHFFRLKWKSSRDCSSHFCLSAPG